MVFIQLKLDVIYTQNHNTHKNSYNKINWVFFSVIILQLVVAEKMKFMLSR